MAARFYLDENISEQLVILLMLLGHEAIGTTSAGNKGASDARQLLFALRAGRIVLSQGVDDFELVHETLLLWSGEWDVARSRHAGILLFPDSVRLVTADAAREIDELVTAHSDLSNRLVSWVEGVGWTETASARQMNPNRVRRFA